jgi:hypothetical protein
MFRGGAWHGYSMLTDLEAVFRSLKSELGLRPVFHHKEARVDGHLFVIVLTYQFLQILRRALQDHGIAANWKHPTPAALQPGAGHRGSSVPTTMPCTWARPRAMKVSTWLSADPRLIPGKPTIQPCHRCLAATMPWCDEWSTLFGLKGRVVRAETRAADRSMAGDQVSSKPQGKHACPPCPYSVSANGAWCVGGVWGGLRRPTLAYAGFSSDRGIPAASC